MLGSSSSSGPVISRASGYDRRGMKLRPEHVRAVRLGHGANCSSVGSVVDTLFVSAVVGGAIFAAVCAALEEEKRAEETPPAPEADE